MKKLNSLILLLALLSFMLTSCSKEEDVKGCYVFTQTITYTASYLDTPVSQTQKLTTCDMTESEAKSYSKSLTIETSLSTEMGWETTKSVCTYKKQ